MGNLQIFREGEWGSLCVKNYYDREGAFTEVACREMGFAGFSRLMPNAMPLRGLLWKAKFFCSGNEASIHDCAQLSEGMDQDGCSHGNIVTLRCRKGKIF